MDMKRKPVKAWALENPDVPGNLFSPSRTVRLFDFLYEAKAAATWQKNNGMQPWLPVRVLITIDRKRSKP